MNSKGELLTKQLPKTQGTFILFNNECIFILHLSQKQMIKAFTTSTFSELNQEAIFQAPNTLLS
jgi:hypothetical protein